MNFTKVIILNLYKFLPTYVKNSNLISYFKFLHWKYFLNFQRLVFLKKTKFTLNKKDKQKIKQINFSLKENGIDIQKPENIFNNNEFQILKNIVNLSNKKILEYENPVNREEFKNFIEKLKNKGVYKPFRYDLGGYQKFKERTIDADNFSKINYEILKIGLKEEFLYLASLYLGIYPFLGRFYAWYDFPTNKDAISSQCWHKDTDDKKFFKIFIYLNEVKSNNGPFCFIKNTHQSNKSTEIKKQFKKTDYSTFNIIEDNEVYNHYSKKDVLECNGSFGTTIFADTSGFHRGKKLLSEKRIMLVFEYFSQSTKFNYNMKFNTSMINTFTKKQLVALRKI